MEQTRIKQQTKFATAYEMRTFTEAVEPFERCYYHLRREQTHYGLDAGLSKVLFSESSNEVQAKIECLFIPLLQDVLSGDLTPDTDAVLPLYTLVPAIRNYLALSSYFISSAMDYLGSQEGVEARQQLQQLLGRSTEIMEYHASYAIERLVKKLSAQAVHELLIAFTHPTFEFPNVVFDFERIPAAHAELTHCKFTRDDHVLFVGCGSLSISGLAYANAGATVTLVDIDPYALESFSRVFNVLPDTLQRRIHRKIVVPGDYCYLTQEHYTHVGIAGLVGQKDELLQSMKTCLSTAQKAPLMLVRTPKPNLLQLFYYDANIRAVAKERYVVSEPNIEAPLVTNVFYPEYGEDPAAEHVCFRSLHSELQVSESKHLHFPFVFQQ